MSAWARLHHKVLGCNVNNLLISRSKTRKITLFLCMWVRARIWRASVLPSLLEWGWGRVVGWWVGSGGTSTREQDHDLIINSNPILFFEV